MKNKNHIITLIAILTVLAASATFFAYSFIDSSAKGELVLRFKPGVAEDYKRILLSSLGLEVVDEVPQIQAIVVSVPLQSMSTVKSSLAHDPAVDFVEENHVFCPEDVPNDPLYGSEWHLNKIGAPSAWDISTGSPEVVIAVLDSGVDPTHPDLAGKLLSGYNFYDNNDNTSDVFGHGTKVAGVAAAISNNGLGVAGTAWQCRILPIRVTDTSGYTTVTRLSKGLIYAADAGAKVAVISFQIFGGSALSSAAEYFVSRGGLVVAAAGNTGAYQSDADNPYIVSVSATTSSDVLASFSTYGPFVDLSAPGVSICTTIMGGSYGSVSGTSFSAPIVAGVAALIFSANPSLTPSEVERILESTAVDLGDAGYDVRYGWGRVDAAAALAMAVGSGGKGGEPTPSIDTSSPSVAVTSPANGSTVSGVVTVTVEAIDNVGVSKVELYKNGALYGVDSDSPYVFYWDTTGDSNGVYTLQAKAYDAAGNVGVSNVVSVSVNNKVADTTPPTIKIVWPRNGLKVSKTVNIQVSAVDDSGVGAVKFYVDGVLVAVTEGSQCCYLWNSKTVRNGWHSITVRAYDLSGNFAEATVKVYVYNR